MFFEVNKVCDAINCDKCQESMDDARILPCGDTVCSRCVSSIHVNNKQFECILCNRHHVMPEEGLPVNKKILRFLSMQPTEVYRGRTVESFKENLDIMQKKIIDLQFSVNNGIEKIKEECIEVRNLVQLVTEQAIQQINEHSDEFIKEVNEYERDCIQSYKLNEDKTNSIKKTIKEIEMFHLKWTQYLKQSKISDDAVLDGNKQAIVLNYKAEQEQDIVDSSIFSKGIIKFNKNSIKIEKSSLGALETVKYNFKCMESVLLSNQQITQLMNMCAFPLNQKWTLIYRASQDGFRAEDFHSKCDNKPNTLVIIKSTNGFIFGGFTRQVWSVGDNPYVFKTDADAFLFSLINKENKPLIMKCQEPNKAILCLNDVGPCFGNNSPNCDLAIKTNSNINSESFSDVSGTYKHPEYTKGTKEAQKFLAGSYKFQTTEIEVYTKQE